MFYLYFLGCKIIFQQLDLKFKHNFNKSGILSVLKWEEKPYVTMQQQDDYKMRMKVTMRQNDILYSKEILEMRSMAWKHDVIALISVLQEL